MGLLSFLRRLRTRPPSGERVELKPLEQVVMSRLIDAGGLTMAEVASIIEERAPVLKPGPDEVMEALLRQGLAERLDAAPNGAGRTGYVPASKGLRLRGRIPVDPRTVTDFWI